MVFISNHHTVYEYNQNKSNPGWNFFLVNLIPRLKNENLINHKIVNNKFILNQ